jgi:hypothetical protein
MSNGDDDGIQRRRAYIGRGVEHEFFGYITDIATELQVYAEAEYATVDEALEWARQHAAEVVLTYGGTGDSVFSAGAVDYGGSRGPLPRWPPDPHLREQIDEAVRLERYHAAKTSAGRLGVDPDSVREDDQ